MAHAASQLKKRADENLNAAEEEKEKKKARKRSREVKKKVYVKKKKKDGVWKNNMRSRELTPTRGVYSEVVKLLFCHCAASSLDTRAQHPLG